MGLVQLFREVPHPDLMARYLLDAALADFRESGHHHLMMLVTQREHALDGGESTAAIDASIYEHVQGEQLPNRWDVDFLFSRQGYQAYGDPLLAVWATILIEICTLEQHWEGAVLGYAPEDPGLCPRFHSVEMLRDTAWLEEAQRTWTGGRDRLLADVAKVLSIVTLRPKPDAPDTDEDAVERDQQPTPKEVALEADTGPFIH